MKYKYSIAHHSYVNFKSTIKQSIPSIVNRFVLSSSGRLTKNSYLLVNVWRSAVLLEELNIPVFEYQYVFIDTFMYIGKDRGSLLFKQVLN